MFGPFGLAGPVLEYLWPSNRAVHGQMVWRHAYNRPIFIVQGLRFERECAGYVGLPLKRQVGYRIKLGTRVLGQGVEKQTINDKANAPEDKQLKLYSLVSHGTNVIMSSVCSLTSFR